MFSNSLTHQQFIKSAHKRDHDIMISDLNYHTWVRFFYDFLLEWFYFQLRRCIKRWRQCLNIFPNTSKFVSSRCLVMWSNTVFHACLCYWSHITILTHIMICYYFFSFFFFALLSTYTLQVSWPKIISNRQNPALFLYISKASFIDQNLE